MVQSLSLSLSLKYTRKQTNADSSTHTLDMFLSDHQNSYFEGIDEKQKRVGYKNQKNLELLLDLELRVIQLFMQSVPFEDKELVISK